ncbi:MAG: ATP-binding protein [Prevotella sp.]|nr:ATP-binding protein [Prevotella sp.]
MKKSYIGWLFAAVAMLIVVICGVVITEMVYPGTFCSDSEDENDKPHILVMFSENKLAYQFADCEDIIAKALKNKGVDADITFEYLNCGHWEANREIEEARKIVDRANAKKPLAMILLYGDQATYSTLSTDTPMMHTLPVVFGGVQFPNWDQLSCHENVTGVSDPIDIVKNIEAAYTLTGKRMTFVMLNRAFLDRKVKEDIDNQLDKAKYVINNLNWDYSVMELLTEHSDQHSMTVLSLRYLYLNCKKTEPLDPNDGDNFRRVTRMFKDLIYIQSKYDPTPVQIIQATNYWPMLTATAMGFTDPGTPYIGGYFASVNNIAADMADCAAKILAGAKPKDIKIRPTKKEYYLDWQVAKRYKFDPDKLPVGYHVIRMPLVDRFPMLSSLIMYSGTIVMLVVIVILLRLFIREKKQKVKVMAQLERENSLYNIAVQDSRTFAWERAGQSIYLSDAFWQHYGHEPKIITSGDFMAMLHPDSRGIYIDGLDHVNKGETFANDVKADFFGNGEWHWYQIRGKGILDEHGNFVKSYGMLINVDGFKQREKEMEEARKLAEEATLKESFLANMSHEIRTPLNAIIGFSDLLLQPDADFTEEDKKLFADTIHTNNDLLLKLINDILDVSRIESGQMDFVIKAWSVRDIMERVYHTFEVQMPKHLSFNFVQPEGDALIEVDESRLRQVIGNFLTNAGKFTPQGSVTLGWIKDEQTGKVELYVEDTGIGLSEEDRTMVFSRFYKKDEFKQGTGLGLSICKAIVIRLGGSIKVRSQLGKGSRFSVYLKFLGS